MARQHTRTRALPTAVAALGTLLALSGCMFIENQGMSVTVVNNTDQDLRFRVQDYPRGTVPHGSSKALVPEHAPGCIAADIVNAVTLDGSLVAQHPSEMCDGDIWVIEQSDLVPIEDTTVSPTPSS